MVLKEESTLIGSVQISPHDRHRRAELTYWVGRPYWGHGYASEAVKRIIDFGFETLSLNRIFARAFSSNPASIKVMKNCSMKYEGTHRQEMLRWGKFEDLEQYSILRSEWSIP